MGYLIFLILTFLHSCTNPIQMQKIQNELNLSNHNLNNLNNLLYTSVNDRLYVTGENQLLSVDSRSLEIVEQVRYGPQYDSINCKYHPTEECLQLGGSNARTDKVLTNNYAKLMLYVPGTNQLLTCWTAFQCTCDLRDANNLTNLVQQSRQAVCVNDVVNTTVGFITQSPSAQDLLLIANTYNANGPYRDDIPAISGRLLSDNSFMSILTNNNQGLKETKSSIEFLSRQLKTFIVRYVHGFSTNLYNYILTVQYTDTDTQLKGDQLITKIIRICKNDLSLIKSYIEIPLKCDNFNELVSAKLMHDNTLLVGLFKQTQSGRRNESDGTAARQAVCVFNMNDLKMKINENLNECLYSSGSTNMKVWRGLNFIKPDQICKGNMNKITDDYCASSENSPSLYPIGGRLPLQQQVLFNLDLNTLNSFNIVRQAATTRDRYTLIGLSNTENKLKFYSLSLSQPSQRVTLFKELSLRPQSTLVNRPLAIQQPQTNLVLNKNASSVYVINKNFLYKIDLIDCTQARTCDKCVENDECSWCAASKSCTFKNDDCSNGDGVGVSTCDRVNEVKSVNYDAVKVNKSIIIEFVSRLSPQQTFNYKCRFGSGCANGYCVTVDVVLLDSYRVMCLLPSLNDLVSNEKLNTDGQSQIELNLMDTITKTSKKQINLEFVNCAMLKSCTRCSKYAHNCNWCSNRCQNSDEVSAGDVQSKCQRNGTCEHFDVGSAKVLVPHTPQKRLQAPIPINLYNVADSTVSALKCVLSQNIIVNFRKINQTFGYCQLDGIFDRLLLDGLLRNGEFQTDLRLLNENLNYYIDTIVNLDILFYSCEYMAADCGACLGLKPYLSCNWCENVAVSMLNRTRSCIFIGTSMKSHLLESQKCLTQKCDMPEITQIEPEKIPIGGGTQLTVRGLNLGESIYDIENVSVCEAKCLLNSDYVKGREIKCLTTSQSFEKECVVSVRLRGQASEVRSVQRVYYVDPQIIEIRPSQLIQSAQGTVIQISGKHLDAGTQRELYFFDANTDTDAVAMATRIKSKVQYNRCGVLSSSSSEIKCSLTESFQNTGRKSLKLLFDTQMSIMHYGSIRVTSNPILIDINNAETLVNGGVRFYLNGQNFVSVQNFTFSLKNAEFGIETERYAVHRRISDERVQFKYPKINFLIKDKLVFYPVFYMDAHVKALEGQKITYYTVKGDDDEPIYQLSSIDIASTQSTTTASQLQIQFKALNKQIEKKFRLNLSIYTKTRNSTYCECVEQLWLNDTYLTCELRTVCSSEQLLDERPTDSNIRLFIGNYEIKQQNVFEKSAKFEGFFSTAQSGSVKFQLNEILILLTSVILLIVCILLVFFVVFIYKRKKLEYKQRLFYFNTLTQSTYRKNVNMDVYKQVKMKVQYYEHTLQKQYDYNYEKLKINFLNEFNNDLIYSGVPLYNYKAYLMNILFDFDKHKRDLYLIQNDVNGYATIKSVYNLNQCRTGLSSRMSNNYYEGMHIFDQLMHNKTFLNSFLTILNKQLTLSHADRMHVSSLILLIFNDNLSYLYSVLKQQLSDLIKSQAPHNEQQLQSHQTDDELRTLKPSQSHKNAATLAKRSLFNRKQKNTIIELLLENLLKIFMYDYIKENFSINFYRLLNVIKYQLECAPIDNCSQLAYNSINDKRILNEITFLYKQIYINCINSHDQTRVYKCKILDYDSIRQIKEKCLDCLYKNSAYSQRACVDDIVLEIKILTNINSIEQQEAVIELKEFNDEEYVHHSVGSGSGGGGGGGRTSRRMLTAKDYCLYDGVYIYISFKAKNFYQTLNNTLKHNAYQYYHLTATQHEQFATAVTPHDPNVILKEALTNDALIQRLLVNKGSIKPFIDALFESIFINVSNLPPIIKNLFDFIDGELKKYYSNDIDLYKKWLNNLFFQKIWINLIKNPQFIFDFNNTPLINSSLDCIASAFAHSCSIVNDETGDLSVVDCSIFDCEFDMRPVEGVSILNELVFSKEISDYKLLLDSFYSEIKSNPSVADHELHFYLNEYSKRQPNDLNKTEILLNIYEYYEKYEKEINVTLSKQQDCSVLIPLHQKIVQMKDIMNNTGVHINSCSSATTTSTGILDGN